MRIERPPEEWLYKAWNDDVMVDLIFRPSGLDVTDEVLARALREQIDWPTLRARTVASPYAEAFFTLGEALGIAAVRGQAPRTPSSRVRVIDGGN
jgi:hypothetical protein